MFPHQNKMNDIEPNSSPFCSKPGKVTVLAFVWWVLGFVLGIWGLWGVFCAALLCTRGSNPWEVLTYAFSSLWMEQHVPGQQQRWCHRAWAQGSPSASSHGAHGMLTLACRVSPFNSAKEGRQDTTASLRSLNTEKKNNWIDFQSQIIYKYFSLLVPYNILFFQTYV